MNWISLMYYNTVAKMVFVAFKLEIESVQFSCDACAKVIKDGRAIWGANKPQSHRK